MKIAFVSGNQEKLPDAVIPLGLLQVMASIAERHEKLLIDLCFEPDPAGALTAQLEAFSPDLVALGMRNIQNNDYSGINDNIKHYGDLISLIRRATDAPVVIGGSGFSVMPRELMERLRPDFGIAGEGEIAFRELVDRIDRRADWSDIPGLVWRGPDGVTANPMMYIEDLDSLRPPRRELFDNQRYAEAGGVGNVVLKQGCSFDCLYCDGPHAMGPRWRIKSPQKVVEELRAMHGLGVNFVWFGLVTVLAIEVGLITPPLGIAAFVVKSTLDDQRIGLNEVFTGAPPYVFMMIIVLVLVVLFPQISLVMVR